MNRQAAGRMMNEASDSWRKSQIIYLRKHTHTDHTFWSSIAKMAYFLISSLKNQVWGDSTLANPTGGCGWEAGVFIGILAKPIQFGGNFSYFTVRKRNRKEKGAAGRGKTKTKPPKREDQVNQGGSVCETGWLEEEGAIQAWLMGCLFRYNVQP